MRNPCKECDYYHSENNTCQSKKCCTGGDGYITWIDRLFCKPYKYNADRKTESQPENLFTDKDGDVWEWRGDAWYCISGQGEPQTEREDE